MKVDWIIRAYESLRDQTVGFENIEWIIVLHDEKEKSYDLLKEIVGEQENVKIYKLNNGIQAASSPRNYALKKATGRYIGFLDADDAYMPQTCKKVIDNLLTYKAQMAVFRVKTVAEYQTGISITDISPVDEKEETVIVSTDNWDSKKFIVGEGMLITARIYERKFLEENNIVFNEKVPFACDTLFNIHCYEKIKTFCYMPSFTGYIYYMIDSSTLQSLNKEPAMVRSIANGIKVIIEEGLASGLYMNILIAQLLAYQMSMMLSSKKLHYSDYKENCRLLSEYTVYIPNEDKEKKKKKQRKVTHSISKVLLKHPFIMYVLAKGSILLNIDMEKINQKLSVGR